MASKKTAKSSVKDAHVQEKYETDKHGDTEGSDSSNADGGKVGSTEGRGQEEEESVEVVDLVSDVSDGNNSSDEGDDFILKEVTNLGGKSYAVNRDEQAVEPEDDDDSDDDEETWRKKQQLAKDKAKCADHPDSGKADVVEINNDADDGIEIWSPRHLLRDSDDDDVDTETTSNSDDEDLQDIPPGPTSWEQFQAVAKTKAGLLSDVDAKLRTLREFFPGGNTPMPENPTPILLNHVRSAAKVCDAFLRIVEESLNFEVIKPPPQLPSTSSTSNGNASATPSNDTDRVLALCTYFSLLDQTRQRLQKRDHRICRSIFYVIRFRLLRILRNRMTVKKPNSEEEFDERLMLNLRIQLTRLAEESAATPAYDQIEDISAEKFLRYWDEIRSFPASFCYDQQDVLADHQNMGPNGFRSQLKLCSLLDFILTDEEEYGQDFSGADSSRRDTDNAAAKVDSK